MEHFNTEEDVLRHYDNAGRAADLLADPMVPAGVAAIEPDRDVDNVHRQIMHIRNLCDLKHSELQSFSVSFQQLHLLRDRVIRHGQLLIRWLGRAEKAILEAEVADSYGDAMVAQTQLTQVNAERAIVASLLSEMTNCISVLVRENHANELPDAQDLLRKMKDIEVKLSSTVDFIGQTLRRIQAREAMVCVFIFYKF